MTQQRSNGSANQQTASRRQPPHRLHRLQDQVKVELKLKHGQFATYRELAIAISQALSTTVPIDYLIGTVELHRLQDPLKKPEYDTR